MKHWEEENDRNASLMSSFAQSGKDCNFSLKSNIVTISRRLFYLFIKVEVCDLNKLLTILLLLEIL